MPRGLRRQRRERARASPPLEFVLPPSSSPPAPQPPDVVLNGHSVETSYVWAPVVGIAGVNPPGNLASGATLATRYSGSRATNIEMSIGGENLQFGDLRLAIYTSPVPPEPRLDLVGDLFWEFNTGVAANPKVLAWDYQTFGSWNVWLSDAWNPSFRGGIGAMTAGLQTEIGGVPGTGTATYHGFASGHYVPAANGANHVWPVLVTATATAMADFAQRSVGFSLTDSKTLSNYYVPIPKPDLDLSGTLNFASGANGFAGTVTTTGGGVANAPMTGTASGFFYGPDAAELGGVFAVSGGGLTAYTGGFGAKK